MKNFGEITKEVLRFGFDDGPQVNKGRIEDWINEAQLQIARHIQATEFEESATISATAGTSDYTLPSEFLRLLSIVDTQGVVRLWPVSIQQYDGFGLAESTPTRYVIFKGKLKLWPTPGTALTFNLRFIKKPPRLSAEGDVPIIPEDYLHLLVDYAAARAYEAEDDAEMANLRWARYKADLQQYAVDVQGEDDRPKQLTGTWGR